MTTPLPDAGPVPEDNVPGHHPDDEQDRPDLDAMAERLGTKPPEERAEHDGGGSSVVDQVGTVVGAGFTAATTVTRAGVGIAGTVLSAAQRQVGRRLGLSR
jgi:hypothetical protein